MLFIFLCLPVIALTQTVFQGLGFSIQPPSLQDMPDNQAIVIFYFPVSEKSAPNVSVIKQTYADSTSRYKDLSETQLKEQKAEIISSKIVDGKYYIEYIWVVNGIKLHFYSKAILKNGKAVLATATATPGQWRKFRNELIKTVESLSLL